MKRFSLLGPGLAAALAIWIGSGAAGAQESAPMPAPAITSTQIVTFAPGLPPSAESRSGYCWTESIVVGRRGVWRCMAGNEIHDPCFGQRANRSEVICGANPAVGGRGFILKLDRPLPPAAGGGDAQASPWMMKLADGSVCSAFSGTLPFIGDQIVRYGCSDSAVCDGGQCPHLTGVLGEPKLGSPWTADKVTYRNANTPDAPPFVKLKHQEMPIETIWR